MKVEVGKSSKTETSSEESKLSFDRAKLDSILGNKNHTPDDVINLLSPDLKMADSSPVFEASTGVGEGYTLREHTRMVMGQFGKYFSRKELPGGVDNKFFELVLALHDVGKPEAVISGGKYRQHEVTVPKMQQILGALEFGQEQVDLACALVDGDPIGRYLAGEDVKVAAGEIIAMRARSHLKLEDFFELLKIYYSVDAGSYTADAGGQKSLDGFFKFEPKRGRMTFSKDAKASIEKLEQELFPGKGKDSRKKEISKEENERNFARLKQLLSVEGDDLLEQARARQSVEDTEFEAGLGNLSVEDRKFMENFIKNRGRNYLYTNRAHRFAGELGSKMRDIFHRQWGDFLNRIYEDLAANVSDPELSLVGKMEKPTEYHGEFVDKDDPDVIDLRAACNYSVLMGMNGLVSYRGNGVDYSYVLRGQVKDYTDESKINDLQPRWVTPDLATALSYANGQNVDVTGKNQIRVYDFPSKVRRYGWPPSESAESGKGEELIAHKAYTDQEASKLHWFTMTKKEIVAGLVSRYTLALHYTTGDFARGKDEDGEINVAETEYVVANKDLRDNLAAVYEEITEGENKGMWKRVYNREGSSKEHLPLREYFTYEDFNEASLDEASFLIGAGENSGNFPYLEQNPVLLAKMLKIIEGSGIDVKKYRRECELVHDPDRHRKLTDLMQRTVEDFVVRMEVQDILARQKTVDRTEAQTDVLKKEIFAKKLMKVLDPFGAVSKWRAGLRKKGREGARINLLAKEKRVDMTKEEVETKADEVSRLLEEKFSVEDFIPAT